MGSFIEINDTLQLTEAQGFPTDVLDLAQHQQQPITLEAVQGRLFEFYDKPDARILQRDPVRMFLVENKDGKWLFWGHAMIQSWTIKKQLDEQGQWDGESWLTEGTYYISKIYTPDYQILATRNESIPGLSYF